MAVRLCEDCGKPREHQFWARCDACQKEAGARARRKLERATGKQFADAVVKAAHEVAKSYRRGE